MPGIRKAFILSTYIHNIVVEKVGSKYFFFFVNWNVKVKAPKMHLWRVDFVLEKYKTNWR